MKEQRWFWLRWGMTVRRYPPTPNGSRYWEIHVGPYLRRFWTGPAGKLKF